MIHAIVEIILALTILVVVRENDKLWKANERLWTRIRRIEKEIRTPMIGGDESEE